MARQYGMKGKEGFGWRMGYFNGRQAALRLLQATPAPIFRAVKPAPAKPEQADFLVEMAGVKRMKPSSRLPPVAAPKNSLVLPRQQEKDDEAVMAELLLDPIYLEDFESGETLSYRSAGITDAVWRKLRRGHFRLQGELDLHGLGRDAARLEVIRYFFWCRERDFRCVRLIHGKGNGSPNSGPVIKRLLDGWLRRRQDVLAFCSAKPCDGGTGAIYVLLRAG